MNNLSELNSADDDQAIRLVSPLIERAPNIARQVAQRRPFASPEQLCDAIYSELFKLNEEELLLLFRAHPELAPDNPLSMTDASQLEQGRLDFTSPRNRFREELRALNAQYQEKFGFPFVIALVQHANIESVMKAFEMRLASDRMSEIQRTIEQIYAVSQARVQARFSVNNANKTQDASISG